jgi:carbamoyltransferase
LTDTAVLIASCRSEIDASGGCTVYHVHDEGELSSQGAQMVGDGKVVGWLQGRMKWGPRALGNRSILCDPRRADMKAIINTKIKRRESFRSFAPSVLEKPSTTGSNKTTLFRS